MKRRVLLAVLLVAARAVADGRAPAAPSSEAKRAYEHARVLFREGDFRGALDELERAQHIAPDPRLYWNMAACENKLGHRAKAIAYVERYKAGLPSLTESERTSAAQFLAAAQTYVGKVLVTSDVVGTRVLVDDELVATTPLDAPLVVDEGAHRVRYERDGYKAVERTENVIAGAETRWTVALERENAPIAARAAPPPPAGTRWGPIVLGASGLVVAAIGGALTADSLVQASSLSGECGTTCAPSRWEKFRTMQTAGDAMLVVGGAAVVGALAWWALSPRREAPAAAALWIAPSPGGAALGGAF